MIDAELLLKVILYTFLIILIVVGIIVLLNVLKATKKINLILDNVDKKANQLNSTFEIVDNVTSTINGVSNKISTFVVDGVSKVIDRKGKKKDE